MEYNLKFVIYLLSKQLKLYKIIKIKKLDHKHKPLINVYVYYFFITHTFFTKYLNFHNLHNL